MKNIITKLIPVCFAALLFVGCEDADNSAIAENMAYIKDAYEKKTGELYLESNVAGHASVPVSLTRRDDTRDIEVTVTAAAEALDAYNKKYNRDYKLYPAGLWQFESEKVVFKKGATGTSVNITIQPQPDELAASGHIYAIPVTITHADGAGVLAGSETFIYILKRVPKATVAGFLTTDEKKIIKLPVEHPGNRMVYKELTVEFLIKIAEWTSGNNLALFYDNGHEDKGGHMYSRIENGGNGGLLKANFEWSIGGGEEISAFPVNGKIELNKWYHVAMTFGKGQIRIYIDGYLRSKMDVARNEIVCTTGGYTWAGAATNTGYGNGVRNATMTSELRLWNVLRTQEQIRENMYSVNPQTPGLLGYWKMNDGTGYTVKDYAGSANGYTVMWHDPSTPSLDGLKWYENQILTVGQK